MLFQPSPRSQASRLVGMAFFLLMLGPTGLFAQQGVNERSPSDPVWQLGATEGGVQFYHALLTCNGKKAVLLKFNNQNRFPVTVSWSEKFTTQFETNISGMAGKKQMVLAPGVTRASSCADKTHRQAVITAMDIQPHYIADISAFSFADISVRKK